MATQSTLLISLSKVLFKRNLLETDFWTRLRKDNPHLHVVLVVAPVDEAVYREHFASERVSVRSFKAKPGFRWKIAEFAIRTALASHSAQRYREMAYALGESSFFLTVLKRGIWRFLAPRAWYQRCTRTLVLWWMQSPELTELYNEIKPDLVLTPSLIDNDFDVPIAAEAKRRGVRLLGMVRSWDNLTSHSLLGVVPDRMFYQNKWIKRIAESPLQHVPPQGEENIVGLPHYDLYTDITKYLIPRKEFCRAKGLDPNKKIILIAGSQLYRSGYILPRLFEELISSKAITGPVQALFRPHPRHRFSMDAYGLEGLRHVVLDEGSLGKVLFSDTDNFVNVVHHADVIVGVSSTIVIDGAVFGTPVIDIAFDDLDRDEGYWPSAVRLFDTEDHYEHVLEISDTSVAYSPQELSEQINAALADPYSGAQGRQQIVAEFVEPFDGKAGQRLAARVGEELAAIQGGGTQGE